MAPGNALTEIGPTSWEEVFSIWRNGEANIPRWVDHYERRGFDSWDEWRKSTIQDLKAEKLNWKIYRLHDSQKAVPHFYGGPFRAWMQKYYGGSPIAPFSEIIEHEEVQKSQLVREMIENFPKKTTLIGLLADDKVVILEGLHRCSALAVAAQKGMKIKTEAYILLAEFSQEIPIMGQVDSPTA